MIEKSNEYNKKYIKIKFNSDDELPLNETIEIHSIISVHRAVFHENNRYYPQVLDKSI